MGEVFPVHYQNLILIKYRFQYFNGDVSRKIMLLVYHSPPKSIMRKTTIPVRT